MADPILIDPEQGDIVRNVDTGYEYVYYKTRQRSIEDGNGTVVTYPVFLAELENGKLSTPYVVLGGWNKVEFVERAAARNPGEKPVRSLKRDPNFEKTTITKRKPGDI